MEFHDSPSFLLSKIEAAGKCDNQPPKLVRARRAAQRTSSPGMAPAFTAWRGSFFRASSSALSFAWDRGGATASTRALLECGGRWMLCTSIQGCTDAVHQYYTCFQCCHSLCIHMRGVLMLCTHINLPPRPLLRLELRLARSARATRSCELSFPDWRVLQPKLRNTGRRTRHKHILLLRCVFVEEGCHRSFLDAQDTIRHY